MLRSKQRAYLRKHSQIIESTIQVGKGGISQNILLQFDQQLKARELVKASVLKTCEADASQICHEVIQNMKADVVQIIGSKFVLFRKSDRDSQFAQM